MVLHRGESSFLSYLHESFSGSSFLSPGSQDGFSFCIEPLLLLPPPRISMPDLCQDSFCYDSKSERVGTAASVETRGVCTCLGTPMGKKCNEPSLRVSKIFIRLSFCCRLLLLTLCILVLPCCLSLLSTSHPRTRSFVRDDVDVYILVGHVGYVYTDMCGRLGVRGARESPFLFPCVHAMRICVYQHI